jgi:hypothetical protein
LLPALLGALELKDGDVRWSATHLITTLGQLYSEVRPVLQHEARSAANPLRRRMAIYTVRELAGDDPETLKSVLAAIDAPDGELRRAALSSLAKLTFVDKAVLDRVISIVRSDPDPRMRRIGTVLLPELARNCPEGKGSIEELLRELETSDDPGLVQAAHTASRRLP